MFWRMMKTKVRKTYNRLIQVGILVLTFVFIYRQVFEKSDMAKVWTVIRERWDAASFADTVLVIIGLMLVNWGIESAKWRYLIGKIEKIGFFKSFYAVLTGVAISSFTPNRVGEFFGRVFVLDKASRVEGTLITILGSMSQLLITLLTGSVAFLIFIPLWPGPHSFITGYLYDIVVVLVVALDLLLVGLFLNISFLNNLKERIFSGRLRKVRKFFRVFAFYRRKELLNVLGMSLLRYIVFASQFYLLLRLFAVSMPYPEAIMIISLIYLVMAIIPTVMITELGIRGSVSLYFFGIYFGTGAVNTEAVNFGVFAASSLLWIINVGIPALTGSLFVFRLHFFRKSILKPTV